MKYLFIGTWWFLRAFIYCIVQFLNLLIHLKPWPVTLQNFMEGDFDVKKDNKR